MIPQKQKKRNPRLKERLVLYVPVMVSSFQLTLIWAYQETAANGSGDPQVKIHTNPEGDKYIDLGKKKRAVVRSFKGIPLLDIREYYEAEGQAKPGKKGISLTIDQVSTLSYQGCDTT